MKSLQAFTLTQLVKLRLHQDRYFIIFPFLDSLILNGEGNYNLNVVKEMKVTDSFIGLPHGVKQCQNKEVYLDCKTKEFLEALVNTCMCLPFSLKYFNDSNISICNSTQIICAQETKNLESKCLNRCEGLVVTSYSHQYNPNVLDKKVDLVESYKKFKAIIDLPSTQNEKS